MIFLDTESIGLVGPTTVIQYGDAATVTTHHVWLQPAGETVALIERLYQSPICAYNLTHDAFHLQRLHNVLSRLPADEPPTPDGWNAVVRDAVYGPCLKPPACLDLYLHVRKGPLQALMDRKPIRIKRVPKAMAETLKVELETRLTFDDVFQARWSISDHYDKEYPDVVLRFSPSLSLKALAKHVLGADVIEYPAPRHDAPEWDIYDTSWVEVLDEHVDFWASDPDAKRYAEDDIRLLARLWEHFGKPEAGDDDSELALQLGASRWRGYAVDLDRLREILTDAEQAAAQVPERNTPAKVVENLNREIEAVPAIERDLRGVKPVDNSRADTLKRLAEKGIEYAARVAHARSKDKEADQARKLLQVGRFHPSFKIIGALSGRMAGSGGLNPQGIASRKKGSDIRDAFLMRDDGLPCLDGGDFASFQVVIAAAVWNDPELNKALATGAKFHGVYGSQVYDLDYDDLLANDELYGRSKNAVFATMFGAHVKKLAQTLALPEKVAEQGLNRLREAYPGIGEAEKRTAERFTPMQQLPSGVVIWQEPAEYVESIYGYRRYFTLENQVAKTLYDMMNRLPDSLRRFTQTVRRRDKVQEARHAAMSALIATAFNLQARNARQAKNHEIQSPEASIAKSLQRKLWDKFQPVGVHPWRISLLPVHDELVVSHCGLELGPAVQGYINEFKDKVPLIAMGWKTGLESWGALK